MRLIKKIITHCSASDNPEQDSLEAIRHLHTANKKTKIKWGKYDTFGRNWKEVGYHYIILKSGERKIGRPLEIKGAHCKGQNHDSVAICLSGEYDFTKEQFLEYKKLKEELKIKFGLNESDDYPHNHFDKNKTCPNFNIKLY